MQRYFGPAGLLSKKIGDFEFRDVQLQMAQAVFEAFSSEVPTVVEAGTGTGKTWAYLIPAFLCGKRVVISTGTKTLQDQILDHDIPVLKRIINPRLKVVCLKGRRNYLCRRRFREFAYQPSFWNREEARSFRRFQKWAERTVAGERAEIPWLPDHYQFWNEVTSGGDQCLGQNCPEHAGCHLTRARNNAAQADLVVVNHHLFLADLAIRKKGFGVLPDYDAVVFDEAHELEDILGLYFGIQFSSATVTELARDLAKEAKKKSSKVDSRLSGLDAVAVQLEGLSRLLQSHFHRLHGIAGRFPLHHDKVGPGFLDIGRQLAEALDHTAEVLSQRTEDSPVLESLQNRSRDLAGIIRGLVEQKDESFIYWYELGARTVTLFGTPAQTGHIFPGEVLTRTRAVVLTSATLSVNGNFDYIRHALGLPGEARELLLASPFRFQDQALLYIPRDVPAPHEPEFPGRIADEALDILTKTRGRGLFLFTSYRNMHEVYRRLQDRLPYPLLVQGEKPKRRLLSDFKDSVESVLFATSSFWQGIDVPGEALSCLLIDKLPFEVPDDPVNAARMEGMAREGRNPFFHYQVPRAIIQLKQGVGRLIRSSQDRGVIAIFDVRLVTKSYGRHFLASLPPCRLVHHKDGMEQFLAESPREPLKS